MFVVNVYFTFLEIPTQAYSVFGVFHFLASERKLGWENTDHKLSMFVHICRSIGSIVSTVGINACFVFSAAGGPT